MFDLLYNYKVKYKKKLKAFVRHFTKKCMLDGEYSLLDQHTFLYHNISFGMSRTHYPQ